MKTIKLAIVGLFLIVANTTQAQVSINVNIGTPPTETMTCTVDIK